ncbi:MAG: ATP-binding protein [Paracoccaceae bacterium]
MDNPAPHTQLVTSLLAGIPLPAILINADEQVSAANPAALVLLGASAVGRHFLLSLRQPSVGDGITQALRHETPSVARYVLTGPTQDTTYRVTISPVPDRARINALCVFEDISELEQMGQMRRDFVANVSHELRTPLTALLGFIETLQGAARDDPTARTRFLGIMHREAERMNRLVRDLLQLSRVESEERVRPTERVDLRALVGAAIATLTPMATTSGVTIEKITDDGDFTIPAEPDQLTQVFHNLIENAVKYGLPGKRVTVRLSHVARDPGLRGPAVMIEVIDRGEGIDPVHLPRLTERFYRVDNHRSREKGGTGLGLAIVKHIVNRHRGRFRIDSTLGQGSVFSVVLPIA